MRSGVAVALVCLSMTALAVADPSWATMRKSTNIEAQELGAALQKFAKDRDVQIVYRSDVVQEMKTNGATGELTVEEALGQLLSGTGLTFQYLEDKGVTIVSLESTAGRPIAEYYLNDMAQLTEPNERRKFWQRLAQAETREAQGEKDAGPSSKDEASSEAGNQSAKALEEVIVHGAYTTRKLDTATGLGLSLHETPQSVSIVTFQRLEDQNLRSLTEVVQNVVGISAKETDSSRYRFAARGFDILQYQVDGVPLEWDWEAGETLLDMLIYERIEVVRGATGLLTGAGNPSASINLVRKHADSRSFEGTMGVSAGRWNSYGGTLDLGTPLNSAGSLRGRLIAGYQDADSYTDWLSNEKQVLYGVLDADIGETIVLSVGTSYQDIDPRGTTWGSLPAWYTDGTRTEWEQSKTTAARWTTWASTNSTYFANLTKSFSEDWHLKFNASRAKNVGDMRLLYLYGEVDRITGLGMSAFPANYDTIHDQDDVGLRLSGNFGWLGRKHELMVGATYSSQDQLVFAKPSQESRPVGNFLTWDGSFPEPQWGAQYVYTQSQTKQAGVFASTRLSLTEPLKVILGGRYADWKRDGGTALAPIDFGDQVFIPYAGALYDVNDSHTVYASYTEIFHPQNYQDRNGAYLPPLEGKGYEAGLKSAFFDEKLYTTISLFKINQDNLAQTDTGFFVPPDNIVEASRAAQGTQSKGYELEMVGTLARGWDVSFSYTDFSAKEGHTDVLNPGDDPSSDINTHQPRKLLRLFSTYKFMGGLQGLTIGGGINWETDTYTAVVNPITAESVRLTQDAFTLVNLMARYDFSNVSVQLNVENLTDENYFSQIGFYGGYAYGRPRNATVNLRYRF